MLFYWYFPPDPLVPRGRRVGRDFMESNRGNRSTESALRKRRYTIRYAFAAHAEIFDLKSATRLGGVTSDLSLGGCFVCTRAFLEISARVRLKLAHKDKTVMALAVVRALKSRTGMGLEFLDVDAESHRNLLAWIESLRQSD